MPNHRQSLRSDSRPGGGSDWYMDLLSTQVRLHETNTRATSLVCLDYWLDAVLSSTSAVALCMHNEGVVQGYRVVPVEQLPSGGGLGEGFSPAAVSECAVSVLRFLRSHCTREAGTYWLVRKPGEGQLHLYDITDGTDTATGGGAQRATSSSHGRKKRNRKKRRSKRSGSDSGGRSQTDSEAAHDDVVHNDAAGTAASREIESEVEGGGGGGGWRRPFAWPLALLHWRLAEQLREPAEMHRRRRLLQSCVGLITDDAADRPLRREQLALAAAAYEALADLWALEAAELDPLPMHPAGSVSPLASFALPAEGGSRAPARGHVTGHVADDRMGQARAAAAPELSSEALAAIAGTRTAARMLIASLCNLRCASRPGTTPPRTPRLLAALRSCLLQLASRYLRAHRPGRAAAVLHRAAAAHAALLAASPAQVGDGGEGAERVARSEQQLLLADVCMWVALRPQSRAAEAAEMGEALENAEGDGALPPELLGAAREASSMAVGSGAAPAVATAPTDVWPSLRAFATDEECEHRLIRT